MICERVAANKINSNLVYEIFISLLALVAVITNIADFSNNIYIELVNHTILFVFWIDYIARFTLSNNKKEFLKDNVLDLIAILPVSSAFRAFRITRLFKVAKLTKTIKVLRIFSFSKRFHNNIKKFLNTNGFIYTVYITISIISLGAVLLYLVEKGHTIKTFEDAIWLSFSTATLFGYEGVENMSSIGKVITGTLILSGIGFAGMFTATTATFFIRKDENRNKEFESKILDLSDLNNDKYNEILNYVEYIRSK